MNGFFRILLAGPFLFVLSTSLASAQLREITREEATNRLASHKIMLDSVHRTLNESNTPPAWVGQTFEVVSDKEGNALLRKEGVRIEGVDEVPVVDCTDKVSTSYEETSAFRCASPRGTCKLKIYFVRPGGDKSYCETVGEPCEKNSCKQFKCDLDDPSDPVEGGQVFTCACDKKGAETNPNYKRCTEVPNPVPTATATSTPTPRKTPTLTPTSVPVKKPIIAPSA